MNPQPTIFISSIITEFYDLRGALKYFLGKNGFRVLMSEEPDFGADCGLDSLDNCKRQIERADYYLLLIGNKPGSIFKINGKDTTVTFEEFKHYISLARVNNNLNFFAFVRKQTWDNYQQKDYQKIDPLQVELIDELLNNTLFENYKIGRWRYTFDKFSDIISTLETNQNGLFLEATRKTMIYRTYIKRELTDIFKILLENDSDSGTILSITEMINLPKLDNLDFINYSKIPRVEASRIKVFLVIITKRDSLLRKINRVFNYIAQGEFTQFDSSKEKYTLPEFIKLSIQTLEILEKVYYNANNTEKYTEILKRDSDDFYINKAEYYLIENACRDLNICIFKLSNLIKCFHENWLDLEKRDDSFYEYRGGVKNITDEQAIDFANKYLERQNTNA